MSTNEALAIWSDLKNRVNYQSLNDKDTHALVHDILSVIRPAVQRGEIPLEVL